jgi:HEAT repeat protein
MTQTFVNVLVKILDTNQDYDFWPETAKTLAQIDPNNPAIFKALLSIFNENKSPRLVLGSSDKVAAAKVLGQINPSDDLETRKRVWNALREALNNGKHPQLRAAAAKALVQVREESYNPTINDDLVRALHDPDLSVQLAAAHALKERKPTNRSTLEDLARGAKFGFSLEKRDRCKEVLKNIFPSLPDELKKVLEEQGYVLDQ